MLESYEGNIPVILAIGGKKFNSGQAVRRCDGLMLELKRYVLEKDIIFFKK